MRYVLGFFLVVFLAAIAVFAVQNTQAVTVRFGDWSATAPFALVAVAAYPPGLVSGGSVVGFVRRSIREVSADTRSRLGPLARGQPARHAGPRSPLREPAMTPRLRISSLMA